MSIILIILFVPIYEYRCEECGKRTSALLASFASADPACPNCGKTALRRLVSTFATVRPADGDGGEFGGEGDSDLGGGAADDFGGGDDYGGGGDDFGDDF
ncbi:MAG TPA: zinc ribbon domain-containing protein [Candidatus Dormibacteraeota bacterium]|jgi:putative FmdB family regulatory protein